MYRMYGKRLFDVLITLLALIVLAPVMAALAVLVRILHGSPILFRHERPGLHGKPFTLLKFRTMTDRRDAAGNLLSDAERLTSLGRFLRSTSLDELPELVNVLKGEMSLVGPRPLLMKYLPYYSVRELKRFTLRPGITGWAQVNGRNNVSWDERLAYDVYYVENCSLLWDLKILLRTILDVVGRKNIQVDPRLTMLDLDEERREAIPLDKDFSY